MKIRDSGMPEETQWATYFDAPAALRALAFPGGAARVADLGCGYGTFTLVAAAMTRGVVHGFDIEPEMIALVRARAAARGLGNVQLHERDFVGAGTGLADAAVDYVMLFNILHAQRPDRLLREVWRVLAPGGAAAVMHWVHDAATPRGPALAIRPRPAQCAEWLRAAGFDVGAEVALPPWHYGLVGRRPQDAAHAWPRA